MTTRLAALAVLLCLSVSPSAGGEAEALYAWAAGSRATRPAATDPAWESYRAAYRACVEQGRSMYVWLDCWDQATADKYSDRSHVRLGRRFFGRFGVSGPCLITYVKDGTEPREWGRAWRTEGGWR